MPVYSKSHGLHAKATHNHTIACHYEWLPEPAAPIPDSIAPRTNFADANEANWAHGG